MPGLGKHVKKSIHKRVENINWKNVFSLDNAVSTVFRTFIGIFVLLIAHFIGKMTRRVVLNNTNDSEFTGASQFQTSLDRDVLDHRRHHNSNSQKERWEKRVIITDMASNIVYWMIMIVAVVLVLGFLGVQIASIIAIISTIAIMIGFSLQGTLSDVASGFILAFFQTYDLGDVIKVDEVEGRVRDFRLVNTVIEGLGSRELITIPNSTIQSSIVRNLSKNRFHNFIFEVRLSNSDYLRNGNAVDHLMITRDIRKELSDPKKYPFIVRHDEIKVLSGVSSMNDAGTKILVAVPLISDANLFINRGSVMTGVRTKLRSTGVRMLDSDYSYMGVERGEDD